MSDYQVPGEAKNINENEATLDINRLRGCSIVDSIVERDAILSDFRKIGGLVLVNGGNIYRYTGADITNPNWINTSNWENITVKWQIITVMGDVNPALPYVYYRVNATLAPRVVKLPDPVAGCDDEFSIEMHQDTHKVTITTVSGIAGAIEGSDSVILPTEGGSIKLKCDGINGYSIIEDHRNLWMRQVISEDRDFTTDGPENNVIYDIKPVAGGVINILFPAPVDLNFNKVIRFSFVLTEPGSGVFTSESGAIGGKTTQIITTLQKGFTLGIFDNKYNIIQDSRPSPSQNVTINFYQLQEASAIGGYRKLVSNTTDPDYNPVTQEEVSASISSETFTTFLSYNATAENTPAVLEAGNVQFNASVKKTTSTQANVSKRYLLYHRTVGGTETLIGTSSSLTISLTSYQTVPINVPVTRVEFADTDMLVMKVQYAKTAGSGTPTITTKYEGTEPAFFSLLVNASSINHNSLDNLNLPNAHTIPSITGLVSKIGGYYKASTNAELTAILTTATEKEIIVDVYEDIDFGIGNIALKPRKIEIRSGKKLSLVGATFSSGTDYLGVGYEINIPNNLVVEESPLLTWNSDTDPLTIFVNNLTSDGVARTINLSESGTDGVIIDYTKLDPRIEFSTIGGGSVRKSNYYGYEPDGGLLILEKIGITTDEVVANFFPLDDYIIEKIYAEEMIGGTSSDLEIKDDKGGQLAVHVGSLGDANAKILGLVTTSPPYFSATENIIYGDLAGQTIVGGSYRGLNIAATAWNATSINLRIWLRKIKTTW